MADLLQYLRPDVSGKTVAPVQQPTASPAPTAAPVSQAVPNPLAGSYRVNLTGHAPHANPVLNLMQQLVQQRLAQQAQKTTSSTAPTTTPTTPSPTPASYAQSLTRDPKEKEPGWIMGEAKGFLHSLGSDFHGTTGLGATALGGLLKRAGAEGIGNSFQEFGKHRSQRAVELRSKAAREGQLGMAVADLAELAPLFAGEVGSLGADTPATVAKLTQMVSKYPKLASYIGRGLKALKTARAKNIIGLGTQGIVRGSEDPIASGGSAGDITTNALLHGGTDAALGAVLGSNAAAKVGKLVPGGGLLEKLIKKGAARPYLGSMGQKIGDLAASRVRPVLGNAASAGLIQEGSDLLSHGLLPQYNSENPDAPYESAGMGILSGLFHHRIPERALEVPAGGAAAATEAASNTPTSEPQTTGSAQPTAPQEYLPQAVDQPTAPNENARGIYPNELSHEEYAREVNRLKAILRHPDAPTSIRSRAYNDLAELQAGQGHLHTGPGFDSETLSTPAQDAVQRLIESPEANNRRISNEEFRDALERRLEEDRHAHQDEFDAATPEERAQMREQLEEIINDPNRSAFDKKAAERMLEVHDYYDRFGEHRPADAPFAPTSAYSGGATEAPPPAQEQPSEPAPQETSQAPASDEGKKSSTDSDATGGQSEPNASEGSNQSGVVNEFEQLPLDKLYAAERIARKDPNAAHLHADIMDAIKSKPVDLRGDLNRHQHVDPDALLQHLSKIDGEEHERLVNNAVGDRTPYRGLPLNDVKRLAEGVNHTPTENQARLSAHMREEAKAGRGINANDYNRMIRDYQAYDAETLSNKIAKLGEKGASLEDLHDANLAYHAINHNIGEGISDINGNPASDAEHTLSGDFNSTRSC